MPEHDPALPLLGTVTGVVTVALVIAVIGFSVGGVPVAAEDTSSVHPDTSPNSSLSNTDETGNESDLHTLPAPTENESDLHILPAPTEKDSNLEALPAPTENTSNVHILPAPTENESDLDILPAPTAKSHPFSLNQFFQLMTAQ